MLELAGDLLPLLRAGTPVAAVTVTRVVRTAPRGVGATLAVSARARVIGSISGGCVEGDAVMLGLEALRTGTLRSARFGFSGDAALPAGLACGGAVEVVAYSLSAADVTTTNALERAASGESTSVGLVMSGPEAGRILPADAVFVAATGSDAAAMHPGTSRMLPGAYDGEDVLLLSQRTRPPLLILGAGEHAAALCRVAAASGFAVTVCDAWALLVTAERFPGADELVVAPPHEFLRSLIEVDERTAVCVLTHDERLDVPALRVALRMPVAFVGAMGARATVARREALLRQAGIVDAELARLHSPLGLDLGGSSPEETAVSVVAEIIANRHRGTGLRLRDTAGPLHRMSGRSCVAETVCA